jgi:hypothetical protein
MAKKTVTQKTTALENKKAEESTNHPHPPFTKTDLVTLESQFRILEDICEVLSVSRRQEMVDREAIHGLVFPIVGAMTAVTNDIRRRWQAQKGGAQ